MVSGLDRSGRAAQPIAEMGPVPAPLQRAVHIPRNEEQAVQSIERWCRRSKTVLLVVGLFPLLAASAHAQAPQVALEPLFTIGGEVPTAIVAPPDGSGRLFIATKQGRVHIYADGVVRSTPFLELGGSSFGEDGLLGLAFHPDYRQNGLVFVYLAAGTQASLIRYKVSEADPDRADPSSARTLLTNTQAVPFHYGGQLAFGPDGFLYISIGDGADAARARALDSLHGKILRIDPSTTDAEPYRVPPDNPLVGQPGARPEIWVWGLRNPWRFSFDRLDGTLFIADVGEDAYEEVDIVAPGDSGRDFGWPRMEGPFCFDPPSDCNDGSLTLPSFGYARQPGIGACAIIGGHRYRGQASPALEGIYFYGDACSRGLWSATESGGAWTISQSGSGGFFGSSTFGEDEEGEVYMAGGDTVFRIVGPGSARLRVKDPAPVSEHDFAVIFEVELSPSPNAVSVRYRTVGSSQTHEPQEGVLEFLPGETLRYVGVSIRDDVLDELPDTVSLALTDADGAVIADGLGTVVVEDDDPGPPLLVEGCTVSEGTAPCVFTVTLSAASQNALTFHYMTVDGDAVAGADYQGTSGTVTFEPGETRQTLAVPVLNDGDAEGAETFAVMVFPFWEAPSVDAPAVIEDDDRASPAPPEPIAPSGPITTPTPVFRWRAVEGATRYRLLVTAGSDPLVEYAAATGCSDNECSVSLGTGLPRGFYQWQVAAGNGEGFGPAAVASFEVDPPAHLIMTAAGTGTSGYDGDGRWALTARLGLPQGVAIDERGFLFIADGRRVRQVHADQTITTVAGNGQVGCGPDGAMATETSLPPVRALTVQRLFGNLYFGSSSVDGRCNLVRRVNLWGQISTLAGVPGQDGFGGDGGPATQATLGREIGGLAVDDFGHVFIADSANRRIRRVDAFTGIITTVAGNGEPGSHGDGGPAVAASFDFPTALARDAEGNLYVADGPAHRVRRIDALTGIITTVAGDGIDGSEGDGGPATAARLSYPSSLAVDVAGNLWIGDEQAHRVRFVDFSHGIISTLVGGGSSTSDGVAPTDARLQSPRGVAVDGEGRVFVADGLAYRVRRIENRRPGAAMAPIPRVEAGEPVTLDGTQSSDPEGDPLTFDWRDGNILLGSGVQLTTPLAAGERIVTLTARDSYGGVGMHAMTVMVDPPQPPVVNILSPANATIPSGRPGTIAWSAFDNGTLAGFEVFFSADDGRTFRPVPGCIGVPGDARECTWPAPGPVTVEGRLRIEARDRAGLSAFAETRLDIEPPFGDGTGLRGQYFDTDDLRRLKFVRIDPVVSFDWSRGSPAASIRPDSFSVRWTGQVEPRFSETYTFHTVSDDGVRLWVGGRLIIDHWRSCSLTENHGTIALSAGQRYPIRLEYFEDRGSAAVTLSWSSPSEARQVVPQTQLYPPATP
jgi:glucose/arabinose dehydrogenase/sugar lactone lactonase YvrE